MSCIINQMPCCNNLAAIRSGEVTGGVAAVSSFEVAQTTLQSALLECPWARQQAPLTGCCCVGVCCFELPMEAKKNVSHYTRWHRHLQWQHDRINSNCAVGLLLSEVLKQSSIHAFIGSLPDYVIVVPQVKFLLVLPGVVHNSHTGDKIDNFFSGGVVQVVAALMSPVSVHPLQSQVAVRSSPVSHVRTSVCLSVAVTNVSDIVSFTKKDLF